MELMPHYYAEVLPEHWIADISDLKDQQVAKHFRFSSSKNTPGLRNWNTSKSRPLDELEFPHQQFISVYKAVARHIWRHKLTRHERRRISQRSTLSLLNRVTLWWDATLLEPREFSFLQWKCRLEGVAPFYTFKPTSRKKPDWRIDFMRATWGLAQSTGTPTAGEVKKFTQLCWIAWEKRLKSAVLFSSRGDPVYHNIAHPFVDIREEVVARRGP
jgi:hypothetical protein